MASQSVTSVAVSEEISHAQSNGTWPLLLYMLLCWLWFPSQCTMFYQIP